MRFGVVYALVLISACGSAVFGQQPPAPQTSAGQATGQKDDPEAPLTPEQEREKQIRQFDLLDPGDKDSQDRAKAASEAEGRRDRDQSPPPPPGSIAAGERNATPPGNTPLLGDGTEAAQEYSGPAVLSRSYSVNRPLIPQQLKWKEFAGVSFIYDTGLTRFVRSAGSLPSSDFTGAQLTWGLTGRHYWRHDQLGVHYSGDYSRYPSGSTYNGANNTVTMDYTHVVSRRISVTLSGTGAIYAQNYTLSSIPFGPDTTIANINLASSPNIQIFDNGTKQFSSEADLTWQKTARLSFNLGGGYFGISRDSPTLQGATGQQARGDVSYRLNRKTTIGGYYSFSHYVFPHGSGNSGTNTLGAIYSYAFSKSMQIRLRGGISRIETLGLQIVPIDPAIATLLGVSTGIIDAYTKTWISDISAQFIKDFRGGKTIFISYARGISPGNGVYQTSRQESISAGLNATIRRRYSAGIGFGRDTLAAVTQSLGNYESEYGRISLSRNFRRGITANFTAEFRHFDIVNLVSARNQMRISTGVTWNPVEGRLWPF